MSKENVEELRRKLMLDERVQHMIRLRAYEIYQMRGHHPGNQAQDWFQAESEVIAFLMADDGEPERENETKADSTSESTEPVAAAAPIKSRTRRASTSSKPAAKKASSSKQSKSKIPAETKSKRIRKQSKPENPQK